MRFAAEIRGDQLERDDALDEHVPGPVDDAHAAFAESCFEPIAAGDDFAEHGVVRARSTRTALRHDLFHALSRSHLCRVAWVPPSCGRTGVRMKRRFDTVKPIRAEAPRGSGR